MDAYIKHGYLWKVPKVVPFSSQILHRPHNDNVLEFMVMEVGSSEGHHQVPQTNQGAVRVSKQTNHHMVLQETWRFGSVLKILNIVNQINPIGLAMVQSSMACAGTQWNMPVLSYFISVFSNTRLRTRASSGVGDSFLLS